VTLWLLDTNMVSHIIHNPFGKVAERLETTSQDLICTSIVVACELRFGTEKRGSARLTDIVERTLCAFDVQPLTQDADIHYARLRCDLERKGVPIGQHDMLIAAHALALDATLVTANTGEFARVAGLRSENWLE
jgi:tRNA(fMet)-specific endonuclease VapC